MILLLVLNFWLRMDEQVINVLKEKIKLKFNKETIHLNASKTLTVCDYDMSHILVPYCIE